MTASPKELLVVLVISAMVFYFARSVALRFCSEPDFSRRRNVWFTLTAVAFLSPNFWLFVLVAVPLLTWATRKDANPVALYLLILQAVPSISVNIPAPGINGLFQLDYHRLLSLCVLVPTALRLRRSKGTRPDRRLSATDVLILAFGAMQILRFIEPDLPTLVEDSATNLLRRGVLFFLDVFVLYVVVSRSCSRRPLIVEAVAALCLSCVVMAALATFESLHHWLLYWDLMARWSVDNKFAFAYPMRGGLLRAEVSCRTPLELGLLLAIGIGLWTYLQSHENRLKVRIGVAALLWIGLLVTYSRGPWAGAVAICFILAALRPGALSRLGKMLGAVALAAGGLLLTPFGERLLEMLPFARRSIDETFLYRQRLAERAWEQITAHPYFGSGFAYFELPDMRQGQGIIDLVNTYASTALFYGVIGLVLFLGPILIALATVHRRVRAIAESDPDAALLGVSLVACMLGMLLMLASDSFLGASVRLFYVLVGFAVGYTQSVRSAQSAAIDKT
jgi:hypothetical protein